LVAPKTEIFCHCYRLERHNNPISFGSAQHPHIQDFNGTSVKVHLGTLAEARKTPSRAATVGELPEPDPPSDTTYNIPVKMMTENTDKLRRERQAAAE